MRKSIIATVLLGALFSCKSQKMNTNGAWQNLIVNNSTAGWHSYGKTYAGDAWKVEDGALHLNPDVSDQSQRGDLTTDSAYENFDLKYEWKISKNGNSGVIFNVNDDFTKYGQSYFTGPEMQVVDNQGHPDAKIHKHRAGDLYDLMACSKETAKPAGEWNAAEIILNKGKLEFFLNGENVVTTTMWDAGWDKMVAGSKFKNMPDFGKSHSGKIAFQDHGDEVWYKNIRIKKL